jgi:dolichol-phosphate mannosyltransferase
MSASSPFFSIIIPAHNEEGCIATTCEAIVDRFAREGIADYEICVVNDNSNDHTEEILKELSGRISYVRYVNNAPPNGFGFAVRKGLEVFAGQCACIVMGDLSDAPDDILAYYREMKAGAECVFGSRFIKGSKVIDYPRHKLWINRLANWFIKTLFRLDYNDVTNAFKCYRREVIEGIQPLLSAHFNLTVEMPLKAVVRGFSCKIVPISWTNRQAGESKLNIKEMGSRYLFIVLYVWLERKLSRGDYRRRS